MYGWVFGSRELLVTLRLRSQITWLDASRLFRVSNLSIPLFLPVTTTTTSERISRPVYYTPSCILFLIQASTRSSHVRLVIMFPNLSLSHSRIDSSSPPRKRRRMSSPTYDEQLEFPSQDELTVIGQLELSLSQAVSRYHDPATGVYLQDNRGHEVRRFCLLYIFQLNETIEY